MLEREKVLPSFLMAVEYKIFDKLYQLAELEEQRITKALHNLFLHLPTDKDVLEAIDVFSFQVFMLFNQFIRMKLSSTVIIHYYFQH